MNFSPCRKINSVLCMSIVCEFQMSGNEALFDVFRAQYEVQQEKEPFFDMKEEPKSMNVIRLIKKAVHADEYHENDIEVYVYRKSFVIKNFAYTTWNEVTEFIRKILPYFDGVKNDLAKMQMTYFDMFTAEADMYELKNLLQQRDIFPSYIFHCREHIKTRTVLPAQHILPDKKDFHVAVTVEAVPPYADASRDAHHRVHITTSIQKEIMNQHLQYSDKNTIYAMLNELHDELKQTFDYMLDENISKNLALYKA